MVSPPSWLKEGPKSASKEEGEAQSTCLLLPAPLRATASQIWSFPYRWGQELASKRAVTQDPRSPRKQTEGLGILPEQHLLVWETVFGNLVSCKASLDHPRTLQRKTMFSSQPSPPDEGSALAMERASAPTMAARGGSLRSCQEGKAIYKYTSGSKPGAILHPLPHI